MAVPIKFQVPQYDPREELRARLDAAAVEHSEALLEAYEVLQGLHDRGILAALKGALGASDMVLESAVEERRAFAEVATETRPQPWAA